MKLSSEEITKLRELGVLDEIALRDEYIRRLYKQRKDNMKIDDFKQMVADEFDISISTVDSILYRKETRKKKPQKMIKELNI